MRSVLQLVADSDSDEVGPELISLAALKLELGITSTSEDDVLAARITRESKIISEFCNRQFAFSNAVETFTFDSSEVAREGVALPLSLYPIFLIDVVAQNGNELDQSVFEIDADTGLLWLIGSSWSGTVAVTYSGGYQLPDDGPAMLAAACIESVRLKRSTSGRDPMLRDLQHGDTSVSYFQETTSSGAPLSKSVIDLISPFRRPAIS